MVLERIFITWRLKLLKNLNIDKELYKRDNISASFYLFFHLSIIAILLGTLLKSDLIVIKILSLLTIGLTMSFLGWSGASHELLHGTVFKQKYINEVFLILFSVISWNNWEYHRISHRIHHAEPLKPGTDYEFSLDQKFPSIHKIVLFWLIFDLPHLYRVSRNNLLNAFKIIPGPLKEHFESNQKNRLKVIYAARIILAFHCINIFTSLYLKIPELLILTFGTMIFTYLSRVLTLMQHLNCRHDPKDPRNASNTIELPFLFRILYWNMNYHIEHHISAAVPTYKLKKFSESLENSGFKINKIKFKKVLIYPFLKTNLF